MKKLLLVMLSILILFSFLTVLSAESDRDNFGTEAVSIVEDAQVEPVISAVDNTQERTLLKIVEESLQSISIESHEKNILNIKSHQAFETFNLKFDPYFKKEHG